MSTRTLGLSVLFLAAGLLGAADARAGSASKAHPAAPASSAQPASAQQEEVAASFKAFASQWMDRMHRVADENRRAPVVVRDGGVPQVSYRGYTDDFNVELRPTGSRTAPFVGLIRYGEQMYTCSDRGATHCNVAYTTPVTEIFRFQNGRWIY